MLRRILAAAALSLPLAIGAAQAQTGGGSPSSSGHTGGGSTPDPQVMFEGWQEETRQAFFTDDTLTHMHPAEDMRRNWAGLSAEQQAQVRADCQQLETNRGSYGEVSATLCSQINEF